MIVNRSRHPLGNAVDRHQILHRGAADRLGGAEMHAAARACASGRCRRSRRAGSWPSPSCAARDASRWRSGAPRRAGAGRNRAPDRARAAMKESRPGTKKRSRPASRSAPLAMPIATTRSAMPRSARIARTADIWPWPPSIRTRSGQAGKAPVSSSIRRPAPVDAPARLRLAPCSFISREKRRSITSRIMPKSSPGVMSVERMLNLRYWFFDEAFRPGDDHGADGIRAHDVGVVVDLDAARRLGEAEGLGEAVEQPRLGRRLGQPAAERLARILQARGRRDPSSRRAAAR